MTKFGADDITHGGFFKSNIRNWLLKECLGSGDPSNFLWAITEIIDELNEDEEDNLDFWEEIEEDMEKEQK